MRLELRIETQVRNIDARRYCSLNDGLPFTAGNGLAIENKSVNHRFALPLFSFPPACERKGKREKQYLIIAARKVCARVVASRHLACL